MRALNRLAKYSAHSGSEYRGTSRRAISLIPDTTSNGVGNLQICDFAQFRQVLLSIEANSLSCCIKVQSGKEKSRALALIFRGRVVGSIYGKKSLQKQVFGREAYNLMMTDANSPGVRISTDSLKDDLALASASLFIGNILHLSPNHSCEENFETASAMLMESAMPGCITVSNSDEELTAIIYMFNGKITRIFSYGEKGGWVANSYEMAVQLIKNTPRAKISASILAAKNMDELYQISFAVSHLSDRKADSSENISKFEVCYALVTNYDHERVQRLAAPYSHNPFVPNMRNPQL